MKKINLFVPQWQDSGHSSEIFHGAHAMRDLVYDISGNNLKFEETAVEPESSLERKKGIYGYDSILGQLLEVRGCLERNMPEKTFTVGGGCGVEVPLVSYLAGRYGNLELYWFDAHGDINSPDTSPSGYFHGMPLRFLLERIEDNAIADIVENPVDPNDVVLVGVRELDGPEREYIAEKGIRTATAEDELERMLEEGPPRELTGKKHAYIHIDLDVLDPEEYPNVKCPADGGLSIAGLLNSVRLVACHREVAGISILENMETERKTAEKLGPLLKFCLDL